MKNEVFDLTQPLSNDNPYLKPLGPFIGELLFSLDEKPVQITRFSMTTHTGTHIDAPRHFRKDGWTIDQIPLKRFQGKAFVLELDTEPFGLIDRKDIEDAGFDIAEEDMVLLKAGWGKKYYKTDFYDHPSLSKSAADFLVEKKVGLVGVDFNGVDLTGSKRGEGFDFEIHRTLLGNDILIMENLNLENIEAGEYQLICFPINITGADAAPVRVVATR